MAAIAPPNTSNTSHARVANSYTMSATRIKKEDAPLDVKADGSSQVKTGAGRVDSMTSTASMDAQDGERERGRIRHRSPDRANGKGDGHDHADDGNSSHSDGPVRKRRRSRKGLDKKFECPHAGCGKSYSRAEHLHRHQLNHTPKQIYMCDYPGCDRNFVRLDLCNRHRDRHMSKGSSLNRKDPLSGVVPGPASPVREMRPVFGPRPSPPSPEQRPVYGHSEQAHDHQSHLNQSHQSHGNSHVHQTFQNHTPSQSHNRPSMINTNVNHASNVSSASTGAAPPYSPMITTPVSSYSSGFPTRDYMSHVGMGYNVRQMEQEQQQQQNQHQQNQQHAYSPVVGHRRNMYPVMSPTVAPAGFQSHASTPPTSAFVPMQNFSAFDLPPSNFVAPTTHVGNGTVSHDDVVAASTPLSTAMDTLGFHGGGNGMNEAHDLPGSDMMLLDQMTLANTMPMFGAESMQKSPHAGIPEDFMTYLFQSTPNEGSPLPTGMASHAELQAQFGSYAGADTGTAGYFPPAANQVMSVVNLLDQDFPEAYTLSDGKSAELFGLIKSRFHEDGHSPMDRRDDYITEGDRSQSSHMLSRSMMEAYLGSYWVHFSDQVPILHKPTFQPEHMPNLLLVAMMAIGAACLDKTHGQDIVKAGAELSNFLALHLRWELFMHQAFRPPAKLWVFQTLLLLELYEKMYSTRELHERAHIHHATTITMMRRGRSLIGRPTPDSPPGSRMAGSSDRGTSRHSSTSGIAHTQDLWWNNWITNEATRRTAFAAFLVDSIHATMFGHSAVMVAHEMRLPLPCDDKLWKAPSGADVGRAEAQLQSDGIKAVSFLEGIKKTLHGHAVKTNAFGRTILMAGLLSVSWHMNQRDLQVNSLGGSQALGGRDKWRLSLIRAFDAWKADYDTSLHRRDASGNRIDPYVFSADHNTNVVFESRVVLHHLAHMATHVDIVDLQIYARARRLLGRAIGANDLASAQRRMKDVWAPSARARDAAFYAMQFLCSVLLRSEGNSPQANSLGSKHAPGSDDAASATYSARDDVLLNRPWVLYFAALVVWSYGFALEGPVADPDVALPPTWAGQVQQMRLYLHDLASVATPDELKTRRGINRNSAMLAVLKQTFGRARWELLHEGAGLLNNCIQLNLGQM